MPDDEIVILGIIDGDNDNAAVAAAVGDDD